jgi:hypothetical protein
VVQSYVEFLRERLKALDIAIGFSDFLRSNARRSLSDQTFSVDTLPPNTLFIRPRVQRKESAA